MEELEPQKNEISHEVGILGEVVASTQELANAIYLMEIDDPCALFPIETVEM